ncbi:MAG: hypothetical protein KC613_25090 [Myxococcales bacterium]|nr:hypothetical protein [Myxococcales bacterium]
MRPLSRPFGWALALAAAGCVDAEQAFTDGRLEDPCAGAVPVCQTRAACVLDPDEFVQGTFPGAQRLIVRTDVDRARVRVRLLFTEQVYPGTELQLDLWTPGCGDRERARLVDIDLFERAGADGILEFTLAAPGRGDHLLDVYSDLSARWTLTVDVLSD